MYRPKHIAEYVALRIVTGIVMVLPQRLALSLGTLSAKLILAVRPTTQLEAERRIRQVFGDRLDDAEVSRIAAHAYRDLAWHMVELMRTPKITPDWVAKNVDFPNQDREQLDAALGMGKGAIIAVAHLANWDIAGVILQQLGYPMTFIVKRQKNPLFDRYLNQRREHLGSEVIERDDPMLVRKVMRSLRRGNVIAIMVDLRARQKDLELPFLGHTVDLMRGAGLISHLAKCPILPAYPTRIQSNRHRMQIRELILPDPDRDRNTDAERILRATLEPLELAIREHPDQYFWFNKKWILERIA